VPEFRKYVPPPSSGKNSNSLETKINFYPHEDTKSYNIFYLKVKVKFSRYRPGVAQRVGRGIALLFHDRVTRRG